MNTYQVIYRQKPNAWVDFDNHTKHHIFIKANTDEDAAYEALDFVEAHKYNLLDVKRIYFK